MAAIKKRERRLAARAPEETELPPAGLCNGTVLRKASRRISQLYDAVLAPCGLRSTQRSILMQVARLDGPSMGELATALVLDRSALAHNIKPLERDGLLRIVSDTHDRRTRRVRLTAIGREKLHDSMPLWRSAQQSFEAVFGKDRSAALRKTLDIIASDQFEQAYQQTRNKGMQPPNR